MSGCMHGEFQLSGVACMHGQFQLWVLHAWSVSVVGSSLHVW